MIWVRIRITGLLIRIRILLFSPVAFKKPKSKFFTKSKKLLKRTFLIRLQRYQVILSHNPAKIEIFLNLFSLLMEGSGSVQIIDGDKKTYGSLTLTAQSTYICRVQSSVLRSPNYWPPPPLSTQHQRRWLHTRRAVRGQYFGRR
jgi:hypothetical protein